MVRSEVKTGWAGAPRVKTHDTVYPIEGLQYWDITSIDMLPNMVARLQDQRLSSQSVLTTTKTRVLREAEDVIVFDSSRSCNLTFMISRKTSAVQSSPVQLSIVTFDIPLVISFSLTWNKTCRAANRLRSLLFRFLGDPCLV